MTTTPTDESECAMTIDQDLEFRLLYELDDDWMPFWGFIAIVFQFWGPDTSPERIAGVIEHLAESGLVTLGALRSHGSGFDEWNVSIDESMRRVADGYDGEIGYRSVDDHHALIDTEVFRANLTAKGVERLAAFEAHGMTWDNTIGPFETRSGLR